ncbi:MAG: DUF5103 domain-containing protein [Bacteroidetes bacterium]|nr:DUF5103 domain-containing protein [Bacteroidota bacterium]
MSFYSRYPKVFLLFWTALVASCAAPSSTTRTSSSPSPDYIGERVLRYDNKVYTKTIRTVTLNPVGNPLDLPILTLGVPQNLELRFDDLTGDLNNYSYHVIHCNADWTPSDLIEMQYIDGFFSDFITDYQVSFSTLIPFVHYRLEFPNSGMRLLLSGNYLLVVTENNDMSKPIISQRFMVVESRVLIDPSVRQSSTIDDRSRAQAVDFIVQHPSFDIGNPLRDLQAIVLQNGRWDNMVTGLQPTFIREKSLEYRYETGKDFKAGNEYRKFNISSVRYNTEDVTAIYRDSSRFVALLTPDLPRNKLGYRTWRDINGRFLVRSTDGFNDFTESDYIDVTFLLQDRNGLLGKPVYVVGMFNRYEQTGSNKMLYNQEDKTYSLTLPFKQGYYEYLYTVKGRDGLPDVAPIEGSYFETENDYTILIYYRDISNDYDQLIGAKTVSTRDVF